MLISPNNISSIKIDNLPSLKKVLLAASIIIFLAIFSYYYIDRAVAEWTYVNTSKHRLHFIWLYATYLMPLYFVLSPWLVFYIIYRAVKNKPILWWHKVVIIMIFSMGVGLFFNEQLRYIFGRYWPATWFNGNLSWIEHKAYGFTWFKSKHDFKSFPSGHTALIFSFMMVLWWSLSNVSFNNIRKKTYLKFFAIFNSFAVAIGLILMCYHFVSDVLIGGLVGSLNAYFILYGIKKITNTSE